MINYWALLRPQQKKLQCTGLLPPPAPSTPLYCPPLPIFLLFLRAPAPGGVHPAQPGSEGRLWLPALQAEFGKSPKSRARAGRSNVSWAVWGWICLLSHFWLFQRGALILRKGGLSKLRFTRPTFGTRAEGDRRGFHPLPSSVPAFPEQRARSFTSPELFFTSSLEQEGKPRHRETKDNLHAALLLSHSIWPPQERGRDPSASLWEHLGAVSSPRSSDPTHLPRLLKPPWVHSAWAGARLLSAEPHAEPGRGTGKSRVFGLAQSRSLQPQPPVPLLPQAPPGKPVCSAASAVCGDKRSRPDGRKRLKSPQVSALPSPSFTSACSVPGALQSPRVR